MKKYQSLDAIRAATREDLAATDAMSAQAADAVYRFFRRTQEESPDQLNNQADHDILT